MATIIYGDSSGVEVSVFGGAVSPGETRMRYQVAAVDKDAGAWQFIRLTPDQYAALRQHFASEEGMAT